MVLSIVLLFKDILKGVSHNPKNGKKKGGIKTHTIIKTDRYNKAAKNDNMFPQEVEALPSGAIITFAKGYVDDA